LSDYAHSMPLRRLKAFALAKSHRNFIVIVG
jgi:hypothetical protein